MCDRLAAAGPPAAAGRRLGPTGSSEAASRPRGEQLPTGAQTKDCYTNVAPCTLAQRGGARRRSGSVRPAQLHTVLSAAAGCTTGVKL